MPTEWGLLMLGLFVWIVVWAYTEVAEELERERIRRLGARRAREMFR